MSHWRLRFAAVGAVLLAVGVAALPGVRAADKRELRLKTERFDRDPGWTGANYLVGKRGPYKRQQFGYQPNREHGRIGGLVWRSLRPAYYGMTLSKHTFDSRLTASGTIQLTQ